MRVFFDSSAFAKRYIEEPGSAVVDAVCLDATEIALSIICVSEIAAALNRRVRERKITARDYAAVKTRFSEEIGDAIIVNLTSDVIRTSVEITEYNPVRAMDALHIACAVEWRADLFVSADKRQIAAAVRSGLKTKTA